MQHDTLLGSALRQAKWVATALLVLVAAIFVGTHFLPPSWWVHCVRAVAEAALVGALADWFAVTALFRRIPLPLIGRHTAIIPRNKDRIAANLASFVQDKFLSASTLIELLRRNDSADWLARWLTEPGNSQLLGQQLARLAGGVLEMVQDRQVERLLARMLRGVVAQMDVSQSIAALLSALTHEGKHQAVLDDVLEKIARALQQERTRVLMADAIVQWLRRDHPLKEKVLPTDWLSGKGAEVIAQALESVLSDIALNPQHRLRESFDEALRKLIERLHTDPAYAAKLDAVRNHVLNDKQLAGYLHGLWSQMRARLEQDLANPNSWLGRRLQQMGAWLGQSLSQDAALRASLNARLERWAQALAPDVSAFIARHINDTVQRWDAQALSDLVEQHIGKDLQFIRINGTVVGAVVGLLLFLLGAGLPQ